MKKLLLSVFSLCTFLTTSLMAQEAHVHGRNCGSMHALEERMRQDPAIAANIEAIERHTRDFSAGNAAARMEGNVVIIPVVVHVIYRTATENVSDAQIQSQITVLNQDFRRTNADWTNTPAEWSGIVADSEIQFELATVDPNGNPTTGITRTSTTKTSFSTNDDMKFTSRGGRDAWPTNQYLNLWVCSMGNNILGYAQFPGTGSASTDGVVIGYTCFGTTGTAQAPFNKGRTATHEVGHWLNLRHIWGDGACGVDDFVTDTPDDDAPNYNCPTYGLKACNNQNSMFMNYMDYVDDACMYMFTNGQKARMRALFATGGARASFATGGTTPTTCGTPSGLASASVTASSATVSWTAVSGASSYTLQYKTSAATTWTSVSNLTGTSFNITGLVASTTYQYQVRATCGTTNGSFSTAASFTTTASGGTTPTYCASKGNNVSFEWIDLVRLGTINRTSGKDAGYFNGTALSTNLVRGTSVTISYSAGFASSAYTENWKIYVDWNRDGDFVDSGELVVSRSSNSSATLSSSFTVPATAALGATRLRVVMSDNSATTSCNTYSYGETEDYTVNVTASARQVDDLTVGGLDVEVFPNPADYQATVKVQLGEGFGEAALTVFDLQGRAVKTAQLQLAAGGAATYEFGTADLSPGLYFVTITSGEGVKETRKLLIQR